MGVTAVKLPYRVLQLVLWVAAVESFSSHFIRVSRRPLEAPLQGELSSASSNIFRRWTVPEYFQRQRKSRSIFSSREPYYDEIDDDGYDDLPSPKFREPSKEEIRLRKMAQNAENKYDDDESDYYEEERRGGRPGASRNGRLAKYDNSFDDYDDFYDDDDDEDDDDYYEDDEKQMAGNFWSNPQAGPSRRGGRQRQPRRYYEDEEDDARRRLRRPQQERRPAPTGFGQPPKVFRNFYDQFFWYGFDIDENAQVGDNTVFGGTKGKFNGFNYLLPEADDDERSRPTRPNSARRLPPSRNGTNGAIARDSGRRPRRIEESDYYLDGDDSEYDDDDEEDDYTRVEDPRKKRKPVSYSEFKPPTDRTSTRKDPIDEYDDYDNYDEDEYMEERRRSPRNAPRYDDDDEYTDRRSGGRRRRRQKQSNSGPEWSPLNMIESFLGIDREEMNYKADVYNAKMGIGKRGRSIGEDERNSRRRLPARQRSARDDPERAGYAYRYDATLDDESTPILDVDLADDEDSDISDSKRRQLSSDVDERKERKKERSWEERQIAMERVPPIDVVGWGPSGELPMSAREKAFMDAQEDIETARRKLNLMKKKESEAKEEITILKVDADRQRLKLREAPRERRSRRDIEELRQIELDIDDASRDLRRSRTKVERAMEKLEELEERHHAIMSCYNIDQASSLVGETLNNFSTSVQGTSAATSVSSSDESAANTGETITSSGTDESKSDDTEK